MGLKFAGLICLLLGVGAFFALWLHTINNRSKTVESETVPAEPHPGTEHPLRHSYSLSPEQKRQATSPTDPSSNNATIGAPTLDSRDGNPVNELPIEARDETADMHIEMANLFFNMGDFEGTMEMYQLIMDNPSASTQQIESAQELKARC